MTNRPAAGFSDTNVLIDAIKVAHKPKAFSHLN